jgi:hypothetical protein
MSEEEQLNAAIAASLNGSGDESPENTNMDIETTKDTTVDKGKQKENNVQIISDKEEEEEELKAGSALDGIKAIKREETTDIANSTRIQLRLGDGKRMIRRFLKTDPVRHLFEFVKAEVPNAETQPFEVNMSLDSSF